MTPTVQVDANAAAVQGSPGSSVPLAISVNNSGSEIGLTGEFGYFGGLFTNSVVKSWYAVIEHQPTGGSWTPLAGIQRVASGYSPASSAPITTGLSATVVPQARFGVTYPSSGDRVVGTQVAGLNTAQWNLDLRSSQTPATIVQLLSSSQTNQIRVRTRIESRVTGLFGIQYTDSQTRTATFTQMLRSQSATASDVRVTVTGDGNSQQFTSSSSPTLASLGASQSVALSASVALPSVQPKQAGESDGDYLNRLRAAAEQSVTAVTTTSHKAGGVATPYWWWIGEYDPGYDIGSLRTITQPASSDTVGVALPIMEIAKQGPPTIDAGTTANYGIDVANTGDAASTATVTDEVDGTAPAAVGGFGSIASGQTASGNHAVDVPANFQSTQLHDRASVTWLDNAGNGYGPVAADVTTTVILDTVPPEAPQLTVAPPALTNSPSATFEFAGEPSGVFKCVVDGAAEGDCLSPVVLGDLTDGAHTFSIWQVDDAGNVGSAIAYAWTVDTTPPAVPQLSGVPSNPTNSASANVGITGESGGSFECDVDSDGWAPCASPIEMSALEDGLHTVDVRQTDAAGNAGDAAHAEWVVDTEAAAAPLLNSTPAPLTQGTTAGFGFAGEPGGSFDCSLDGASFAPCANPVSYEDLLEGDHTFAVRQTDDAGNVGEIAAFSWTIDHTAPGAPSITSAPSSPTNQTSASFEFAGEPSGTIECKLDGGEFAACASPSTYAGLTDGTHTFSVRQTDDAGNVGSATTHTWQVDNTPPAAPTIDSAPAATIDTDSATFAFSGEPGAEFECSFDSSSYVVCESPKVYADLAASAHIFAVRQNDSAGNASAAATASFVVQLSGTNVGVTASTLTVASDPGSQNTITVSKSGAIYTVTDSTSQITAAPGCTSQDAHTVTCADVTVTAMEPGIYADTGDSYLLADGDPSGDPQITEIVVSTGDLDDSITIDESVTVPATIDGGDGNDQLTGGPQPDTILGGDGADQIESVDSQIDQVSCGAGIDTAHIDTTDVTDGCENVSVPTTVARVEPNPAIPGFEAIEYRAAPGENNNVSLSIDGSTVTYSDIALEIVAGPGCSQVTPQSVSCDFTGVTAAYTFLKDGDDSFAADPASDALSSGVYGGEGDDVLHGGPGMDGFEGGPGADTITGAGGFDTVIYTYADLDFDSLIERDEGVEVTLDGEPNDGAPSEGDNVASDIEWIIGTNHADTLTASDNDTVLSGFAGDDALAGGSGNDRLHGNEGDDVLDGGLGDDYIDGYEGLDTIDYSSRSETVYVNWSPDHPGNGEDGENDDVRGVEKLVSGAGDDFLRGTSQADVIEGGPGEDTIEAEAGADDIKVRDGQLDHVQCGVDSEVDTVTADATDDVQGECDGNDVVDRPPTNVNVSGTELAVTLDDATKNTLEVNRAHGQYILANTSGGLVAGAGCQQRATAEVVCQVEGVASANVTAGNQGDSVTIGKRLTIPATLNGGAGADVFVGGSGNDNLTGSSGDDELDGRAGTDLLDGSSGADTFVSSDGEADTITCDSNDVSATVDRLDATQVCDSPEIVSVAAFVTLDFGMPLPLFVYYAAPEQQNDVVSAVTTRTARFTDSESGIVAGSGCTQVDEYRVDCLGQDALGALVYLGDGHDQALSRGSTAVTVVSAGEAGDDELRGGAGTDVLDGGPGNDRLFGGAGGDNLAGGEGDDTLDGGSGADIADGGAGDDTMDYSSRTEDVTISITDGSGDNGEIGEHDITAAGIENVAGGGGDDQLLGNDLANRIDGGPGDDVIDGLGGDDAIGARDGSRDEVNCSEGVDSVEADTLDEISVGCQQVERANVLRITDGPADGGYTNEATSMFEFQDDGVATMFECKADGEDYASCVSPFTTGELSDGEHTLSIRAGGTEQGNPEEQVSRSFTVDTAAPSISITAGPEEGETIGTTSPTFAFSSPDAGATFECAVDTVDDTLHFRSCRSPYRAGLGYGDYEFEVRAVDAAGNRSDSAVRNFDVSPSAIAEFGVAPPNGAHESDPSVLFTFSGVDAAGFECSVDGGEFAQCTSPNTFYWPYVGSVSFGVRAIDMFGNPGPTIKRTLVFESGEPADDSTRPKTLLDEGPENDSNLTYTPVFEFSSNEKADFLCRLDDLDWSPCGSPWSLTGLADGEHRVEIGAIDTSGNFTDAPVVREFNFDPGGDGALDLTLPPPLERANGISSTVNFDLGEIASAQVNINTGELAFMSDDLTPSEDGTEQLTLARYYNSQSTAADSGLGSRWSLGAGPDVYLVVQSDARSVELHGPGGYVATFWRDEDDESSFTGPPPLAATLRRTFDGGYMLESGTGEDDVTFDSDGHMVATTNLQGNIATVANREIGGKTVLDSYGFEGGDTLTASYGADDRLVALSHSASLPPLEYQYGIAENVEAVISSEGNSTYSYDENGFLSGFMLPDGTTATISLDAEGRTQSITLARDSLDPATTSFEYGASLTTVTKPDGTQSSYANEDALDGAGFQNPAAHDQMSDSYASANGVSPSEADAAIDIQVKSAKLGDALQQELGTFFGGLWYAPADGGRVKAQVGPGGSIEQAQAVVDAFGATDVVDVIPVQFTADHLASVATQISGELSDLIAQGLLATYRDDERNQVVLKLAITADTQQRQSAQTAVDATQGAAVIVEVEPASLISVPMRSRFRCIHGDADEDSDEFNGCNAPLRGSMGIGEPGWQPQCSNAFIGNIGKIDAMLTAGHCISEKRRAAPPSKRKWAAQTRLRSTVATVGRNIEQYEFGSYHSNRLGPTGPVGGDAGAIRITTRYWKKPKPQARVVYKTVIPGQNVNLGPADNDYLGIHGAVNVSKNQTVCIDGAHSGAHCGYVMETQVGQTLCEEVDIIDTTKCAKPSATLQGMVDVDLGTPGNCGIIPGDSGGPVVQSNLAVGIISSGDLDGCGVSYQPMLDNADSAQPNTVYQGALHIARFCLLTVMSKKPRCWNSMLFSSLSADIRVGAANPTTNGQPSFFITPRGSETDYSFQIATDPAGEHIVFEAPSRGAGEGYEELQLPGSEYAGCVLEDEGRYIRVFAQNANGVSATKWVHLPKNCDVVMSDPPATTLSGGRRGNALGAASNDWWIVDAATTRGSFDLPPDLRLQLKAGYENCDQNHDVVPHWAAGFGVVSPGEVFNCRFVPQCHPLFCGDEQLDPDYGMDVDGSLTTYELPPNVPLSEVVPAIYEKTLSLANPDGNCSDGLSHFRHITTPIYTFKPVDVPYTGLGIVRRGNAAIEDYPSYICS